MSLEEYSLKLSKLSKYAPYLPANLRDEMSHFMTGIAYLVMEEFRMAVLHDDMTVARIMVSAKSIEGSKLKRMVKYLKKGDSSDHEQTRVKKGTQT